MGVTMLIVAYFVPLLKWDLSSPTEAFLCFFNRGHGCMRRSLVGGKCYLICSNSLSRCVWYMQLWTCHLLNERFPFSFSFSSCLTPVASTADTPGTREITHKGLWSKFLAPKSGTCTSQGEGKGEAIPLYIYSKPFPLNTQPFCFSRAACVFQS